MHDRACECQQLLLQDFQTSHSITKGAMIQLTKIEKATCVHNVLARNEWWRVSKRTLHKIGYIMARRLTAWRLSVTHSNIPATENVPIGTETPMK